MKKADGEWLVSGSNPSRSDHFVHILRLFSSPHFLCKRRQKHDTRMLHLWHNASTKRSHEQGTAAATSAHLSQKFPSFHFRLFQTAPRGNIFNVQHEKQAWKPTNGGKVYVCLTEINHRIKDRRIQMKKLSLFDSGRGNVAIWRKIYKLQTNLDAAELFPCRHENSAWGKHTRLIHYKILHTCFSSAVKDSLQGRKLAVHTQNLFKRFKTAPDEDVFSDAVK